MNATAYVIHSAQAAATTRAQRHPVNPRRSGVLAVMAVAVLGLLPGRGLAQPIDDRGAYLAGLVGSGFAHADRAVVGGVAVGYRFVPRVAVELDAAYMSGLEVGRIELPIDLGILNALLPTHVSVHARTWTLLGNLVTELPLGARVRSYAVAGGGIAAIAQRLRFTSDSGIFAALPIAFELPSFPPALNVGGGFDIGIVRGFGVGVDLRYVRLFLVDRDDLNIVRLVGRAGYRF